MFRSSINPLQRAGVGAAEIALSRFINATVFETKLGDLGMILSLAGIDPNCRTEEVLNAYTRRYESAIRLFDDRFRVYSYIVKRSGVVPSTKVPVSHARCRRRRSAPCERASGAFWFAL